MFLIGYLPSCFFSAKAPPLYSKNGSPFFRDEPFSFSFDTYLPVSYTHLDVYKRQYKNRDEVRLWVPKRAVIQKLDRLTALRNRLIKVRKMMQTPLTDCKDFISKGDLCEARKGCQNTLKALDGDIKKVNQDIQCTIQSDPYLRELYELIESVKGVGPAIATEILIVTNERPPLRFKNINEPKKFACHAGVVPFVYASGQYKGCLLYTSRCV